MKFLVFVELKNCNRKKNMQLCGFIIYLLLKWFEECVFHAINPHQSFAEWVTAVNNTHIAYNRIASAGRETEVYTQEECTGCQSRRMINEMCWPNLNINWLTLATPPAPDTPTDALYLFTFWLLESLRSRDPSAPGRNNIILRTSERATPCVCERESVIHYHNTDMQASAHTEVMLSKVAVLFFYYFCSFISIKLGGNEFFPPHSSCIWIIPLFL